MKVIAFTKYGEKAASTRQRLLQYIPYLNECGIDVEWHPLIQDSYINKTGNIRNIMPLVFAYASRMSMLLSVKRYDLVWIHKEIFPYTPGWFEVVIANGNVPVVYDFDDAIFHNYNLNKRKIVRSILGRRMEPLLRRAKAASCGNEYLQDYAKRFCKHSVLIPTVVDIDNYHPNAVIDDSVVPVIGWIGSYSTWQYVKPLVPMLKQLVEEGRARVRIIGAGATANEYPAFEMVEWSAETEIAEVQQMHIGIMPLTDDPWSQGKCGYKLIQYMACGLPVVASPVGVNVDLALPGVNGILADTVNEWREALIQLLNNASLRAKYGAAGRERVERDYSLQVHAPRFIELLYWATSKADS